jgi:hypothetical protein
MINFDVGDIQKLREQLDPKKVDKAMKWSLDAIARKARTMVSREVRKTYDIKASQVSASVQLRNINSGDGRLLLYTGSSLPLEQFKPQVKNVSVTVSHHTSGKKFKRNYKATTLKIRKDRGRKVAKGAFYHGKSVLRRSKNDKGGFDSDQAFKQFGPSIPGMVKHEVVFDKIDELVKTDLKKTFNDRLEYILGMKS